MTLDEREAFIDYYLVGRTDEQIAVTLGFHRSRVHQLRRLAVGRVHAHLFPMAEAA